MAQITAALVKELREKTGAGMMDCKKALIETDGDVETAVDWLRKKGLSAASKKAGRTAAEGLIGIAVGDSTGAMVEINSETDFVARNEHFQAFVRTASELSLANDGDTEAVMQAGYPGEDRTVEEQLTHLIATIGENMSVRRTTSLSVENGVVSSYIHNAASEGLGKIGVLVALASEGDAGVLAGVGKQLAMHIAAAKPQALSVEDLDPETVARERNVLADQARASGKPENIIEKMIDGRMRKFYEEAVLLKQVSVIDQESTIEKVLEQASAEAGAAVEIASYAMYVLGEGIDKGPDDFAAEVKAAAGL